MKFAVSAFALMCCCQAAPALGQNIAGVDSYDVAQNKSNGRLTELSWSRTFSSNDVQRLFRADVPSSLQTTLECDVASNGALKRCKRERAPDLPRLNSYYEAIERSFVVSPQTLASSPSLWVFVAVRVSNSAGMDIKPFSCLSAFCNSIPAPPPVYKGEGRAPAPSLKFKSPRPRFPSRS